VLYEKSVVVVMSKNDEERLWYLNILELAHRIPKDVVMFSDTLAYVQSE
jgi:hypothetical protein